MVEICIEVAGVRSRHSRLKCRENIFNKPSKNKAKTYFDLLLIYFTTAIIIPIMATLFPADSTNILANILEIFQKYKSIKKSCWLHFQSVPNALPSVLPFVDLAILIFYWKTPCLLNEFTPLSLYTLFPIQNDPFKIWQSLQEILKRLF